MGRAMVARLGLGPLLLALLLPTQIYSNQTTVVTMSSNSSPNVSSTAPSPTNATSRADGNVLQSSAASLLMVSLSLLHLYC
uniref:CD24 molecule n=1 Tax=Oryctolagus cuniculus TaxID=9986 RepID=G1SV48_RABIT